MGLFVLMLDSTVVALALPSIHHDLGASRAELQWMLNGYLLVIAALVVTGGRLGGIFCPRPGFSLRLALFRARSVLPGAAPGPQTAIARRLPPGGAARPRPP